MPPRLKAVVMGYADDQVSGIHSSKQGSAALPPLPATDRNLVTMTTDGHG